MPHADMVIRLVSDHYVVDHYGKLGREVLELFGTTRISTPFMRPTTPEEVLETIQQRNPEHVVVLG